MGACAQVLPQGKDAPETAAVLDNMGGTRTSCAQAHEGMCLGKKGVDNVILPNI